MLGSFFAGIAITNAGTGLCHAMAYPLGSAYHVPHGMANALLLPAVLEYNMTADLPKFAAPGGGPRRAGRRSAPCARPPPARPRRCAPSPGRRPPRRAARGGRPRESALEGFVDGALSAARLVDNNPRRPTPEAVLELYRQSFW